MFLLIDKPKGMTSHDVIDRVRRITGIRKVGHAGTLDPNATGLLIVAVGRDSTKKLGTLTTQTTKEYLSEVVLGETRDTDDSEGVVVNSFTTTLPTRSELPRTLNSFAGKQKQMPPAYSAIKLQGKKAYEIARSGGVPELKMRDIEVHLIELVDYHSPQFTLRTIVSAGTYIRSLARDIGERLETGAYLANIRRMAIGPYRIENATPLEGITPENWESLSVELLELDG